MKRFAVGTALVLTLGGLSACGGDGDKPAVATKKEFCAALDKVSGSKNFKEAQRAVKKLEDVGTPKGIPAEARQGLDKLTGIIGEAKNEKAARESLEKLAKESAQTQKVTGDYIAKTCN